MIVNKKIRVVTVNDVWSVTVLDNCGGWHDICVDGEIIIIDGYRYKRYANNKSTGAKYLRLSPYFPKRITDICPGFDFRFVYYSLRFGYPVNSV